MIHMLRSDVRGPLGPYAAGFASELSSRGYSPNAAAAQMGLLAHLSRWMSGNDVVPGGLAQSVLDEYVGVRRAAGYRNHTSVRALAPLLSFLANHGVLRPPMPAPRDTAGELLARYRRYLQVERGLTAGTARCYLDALRPFAGSHVRGPADTLCRQRLKIVNGQADVSAGGQVKVPAPRG